MAAVEYGTRVFPGFVPSGFLCDWCDGPTIGAVRWSEHAWTELEMLERGSWPRRIQDLIDNHPWHPNCRCSMFPQADQPNDQS